MGQPLRLIMFGRQGSGKGTQCQRLVSELGIVHLSTGDILRANIESGTQLGQVVAPILAEGGLVDDQTMLSLVEDALNNETIKANGFILDGYPRTLVQAKGLMKHLELSGGLDAALNLDVEVNEVLKRIEDRGRSDDVAESIKERLRLYEVETVPVIDWFQSLGLLKQVDGIGSEIEVTDRLLNAIGKKVSLG